jgi:transcriptional regulator with PAS, ATPase and Fis domain
MSLALQVKLLRVLEDGEITRVGGNTPITVDVRTIFATAKDLDRALADGSFREDLYYRINVVPINLPPLRERGDDKIKLMQHFLRLYADKHNRAGIRLSQEAQAALLGYDFPGNIRELRNIMERSILLAQDGVVRLGHLPQRVIGEEAHEPSLTDGRPPSLEEGVRRYEKERIIKALEQTGNRKILAADLLGISRKVLWKKMKAFRIVS